MLVLKRKEFSNKKVAEKKKDKDFDDLSTSEKSQAMIMWGDGDYAGKSKYNKRQAKSGLTGAAIGGLGATGLALVTKHGEVLPAAALMGGIAGSTAGRAITKKGSEKIAKKIWDKSDKEYKDYINADSKTKRKIEENYIPIQNRINDKGEDLEEKDYVPYNKARTKAIREELTARIMAQDAYKREKARQELSKLDKQASKDKKKK